MSEIEFLERDHIYLVDGVITPSVTQIVRTKVDMGYAGVPKATLERAASYGNQMHDWVEGWLQSGNTDMSSLTKIQQLSAEKLLEMDQLQQIAQEDVYSEIPVAYKHLYAGKYDLLVHDTQSDSYILADIKTTAKFNIDYLEWQLGLYKIAIEYTHGKEMNFASFYCLWMPKKQIPQLISIQPKTKSDCIKAAEDYRDSRREEMPAWLIQ